MSNIFFTLFFIDLSFATLILVLNVFVLYVKVICFKIMNISSTWYVLEMKF